VSAFSTASIASFHAQNDSQSVSYSFPFSTCLHAIICSQHMLRRELPAAYDPRLLQLLDEELGLPYELQLIVLSYSSGLESSLESF
jgi:hypothetical protein